jgi:hypothetical protein
MKSVLVLIFLSAVFVPTLFGQAASPNQTKAFIQLIHTAWEKGTDESVSVLFEQTDADPFQVDTRVSNWRSEREHYSDVNAVEVTFHDLPSIEAKAALEKEDGGFYKYLKEQRAGTKVMNGHTYEPNLPVVGFMELSFKSEKRGSSKTFSPVGCRPDGLIRFVLQRRKK